MRYKKEFLVPYLHNICALHLTIGKIKRKIDTLNAEIRRLNEGQPVPVPSWPEEPHFFGKGAGCFTSVGLLFLFACICGFGMSFDHGFDFGLTILYLIAGAAGVFCIGIPVSEYMSEKEKYEQDRDQYEIVENQRQKVKAENQRWKDLVPVVTEERNAWRRELSRVEKLLQQAYVVNIIPRYYRGLYPAVYLYDWFRYSQEDDIAMALNMFVLEEIKSKLDRIIDNQSEIILNQYIQEANQRRAMEQDNDHHQQLMRKLDRISNQNDDRNNYLKMIASTSAADAYFSAANYLRNL